MTSEEKCVISLIRDVLHNADEWRPLDTDSIDYSKVFQFAKNQSVANTLFRRIDTLSIDQTIKDKFKIQYMLNLSQYAKQCEVIDELKLVLEKMHCKGLYLKGAILRDYYPDSALRTMSDIDVFCEKNDIESIHSELVNKGFVTGVIGAYNHYEYLKYESVKVEFHPELVALDSEYGRQVYSRCGSTNIQIADKLDIWNHSRPIGDSKYSRELLPEYHYIYIVMHMMNHFLTSGTGIRSVMDIWVINERFAREWNREEIDSLLSSFGLNRFEKYAVALADRWFTLKVFPKTDMEIEENDLDLFEDYILSSGTHGSYSHHVNRVFSGSQSFPSKIAYFFKIFFLPYKSMKSIYPILRKVPVLLPVLWVHRGITFAFRRRSEAKKKIGAVMNSDAVATEKLKRLFESVCPSDIGK